VAKPKKQARRNVGKVPRREVSGGKKSESPAGSGRSPVKGRKSARDPKRNGGAPTISAPYLGEISLPVISEVARSGSPDSRGAPRQLSLPVYGNYCGFGHGDPTWNTPPIDAVDAVCREHDRCYALLGDFDSRCDQDFIESMPSAIASTPSPAGKKAGLLGLLYFSLAERNLALGETLFKRT
jgi:hypothetical protein